MKLYFLSFFTRCLEFLFIEVNHSKYVKDLLPANQISVFEYFNMISDLFFQSLMDLYHVACQGLQNSLVMTVDKLDVFYKIKEKEDDNHNSGSQE